MENHCPSQPVDILLSTYNGSPYLPHLFDSLLSQTFSSWQVLIRDDGSSDSTIDVIKGYQKKYPDRFIRVGDSQKNIGINNSVARLLERSKGDYIAFCDQDDIWAPEKLENQLNRMASLEECEGTGVPFLVHSDLRVCNESMEPISDSMWNYQKINPELMKDIRIMLVHNFVTGCTMMINRTLKDMVCPMPGNIIMYDWWIALLAQEAGKISSIQKSLVHYRQHTQNLVGARKWSFKYLLALIFSKNRTWFEILKQTPVQAGELLKYANGGDYDLIYQFSKLRYENWLSRKILYKKLGIKKSGGLRQLGAWLAI